MSTTNRLPIGQRRVLTALMDAPNHTSTLADLTLWAWWSDTPIYRERARYAVKALQSAGLVAVDDSWGDEPTVTLLPAGREVAYNDGAIIP